MSSPSYQQSRVLLLGTGSLVLIATALVLLVRAYDPVEVLAVIFFLPVFVAAVFGGIRWGVPVALVAGLSYLWLRTPDIQQFGWAALSSRIIAQSIGYIVFGTLGGWAAGVLAAGIVKLDRFDVRDDETGLLNARGLHEQLSGEHSRATRYGSSFSVVTVHFNLQGDARTTRRQIGDIVRGCVRSVDEPGRVTLDGTDLVVTVLPETPAAGAEIAGSKIAQGLEKEAGGVDPDVRWLSHPHDDAEIRELLELLAVVVRRDHPEAAART